MASAAVAAPTLLTSTLPCCALLKPPMANSAHLIVSLLRTYMQSMLTSRCIKWIRSPATTKRKSYGAQGRGDGKKSARMARAGVDEGRTREPMVWAPFYLPCSYQIRSPRSHAAGAVQVEMATLLGTMRRHTCERIHLEKKFGNKSAPMRVGS